MKTRLSVVACVAAALLLACSSDGGDDTGTGPTLTLTSNDFTNGGNIALQFGCQGPPGMQHISPHLSWSWAPAAPTTVQSYALTVIDTTPPGVGFIHWIVWNIPTTTTMIPQQTLPVAGPPPLPAGAVEGMNTAGNTDYVGPCPPNPPHTYVFKIWALDVADLSTAASSPIVPGNPATYLTALEAHDIASGTLSGSYP